MLPNLGQCVMYQSIQFDHSVLLLCQTSESTATFFIGGGDIRTYRGPHVLIRRGVMTGGVLASVFLPDDAVFTNGLFGIAGPPEDTEHLKIVCACLNSSLARYYQFLTASQWGVERDEVLLTEHKSLPCAIPEDNTDLFRRIVGLVDRIQEPRRDWRWQPRT